MIEVEWTIKVKGVFNGKKCIATATRVKKQIRRSLKRHGLTVETDMLNAKIVNEPITGVL